MIEKLSKKLSLLVVVDRSNYVVVANGHKLALSHGCCCTSNSSVLNIQIFNEPP